MSDEIRRDATLEHLAEILAFVESSCREARLPEAACFDIKVAVDEVCTNIIHHGYASPGPIDVRFRVDDDRAIITVADEAVLFDPATVGPADVSSEWEDRAIGGLGWHLVRRLMDEVRHEPRPGGGNVVTLIKIIRTGGER